MSGNSSAFAVRARYLFPVSSPPLTDGVLTIREGRIVAVGENLSAEPPRDLGNVAILPGLVNAHTHLEFSDLEAPLGAPGMPFADWIRAVIDLLRAKPERSQAAVERGLAESWAAGVVALGEIALPGWPENAFSHAGPSATVFLELLGLRPDRLDPLKQLARAHLMSEFSHGFWRPGLSPHAPYTVNFELLRYACKLSAQWRVPLAMHLAETAEELELLASHSGPLVELLSQLEAWDPGAIPRGIRPLDYLRELSSAARALVIHGNYLSETELAFLAEHRNRMSLVYCPRTHAYFGHGRYPLPRALALGANIALGTDSRASNPDLCLFAEMRHVAHVFPEIDPAEVLRMGTQNAALALGIEDKFGRLAPGLPAHLCLVPISDRSADPHELLFESGGGEASLFTGNGR
jgi:cytosine/adenosine deaminase-related metal-dependent hydrolase